MKKALPILIIITSLIISFLLQFELFTFYSREYKQLDNIESIGDVMTDSIVEIEVTPNLFFYLENKDDPNDRYFITYEYGGQLLVNIREDIDISGDKSIEIKGTVSKINSEDNIYNSILEKSTESPLVEIEEGIDESLLDGIDVDWSLELADEIYLFDQIRSPESPNTRFLLGTLLVIASIIVAAFVAWHNEEEE